nr:hypothetical protein [Treponema sp.]
MKKIFFNINILLIPLSILLFSGCAAMEGAGKFLDGSVFAERRVSLYKAFKKDGYESDMELKFIRDKNKEISILISASKYPMMKLRASNPGEDGTFILKSLEYLAGSTHGWNEYTLELIGEGKFDPENPVLIISEIETVQIIKGRIHRYDTRITGNEAVTALRNRRERVQAIVSWMSSQEPPVFPKIKEFENYWEPVLFPEIVSRKKRPADFKQEGDERKKTDDIRWNTSYTERVFPEELWNVRNTGTLLRDWEDALSWIYMEYEWEKILELFSNEIIFNKIK